MKDSISSCASSFDAIVTKLVSAGRYSFQLSFEPDMRSAACVVEELEQIECTEVHRNVQDRSRGVLFGKMPL